MFKIASQDYFDIITSVEKYRQHLNKIDGELLAILVGQPASPLGGIASAVDWRLNSIITQMVSINKFNASAGSLLLIPSNERLNAKYVMLVGHGKNFKTEIIKALKGLKIKSFCLIVPKQFKKEVKQSTFDADSVKELDIGEEKLYIIKGLNL